MNRPLDGRDDDLSRGDLTSGDRTTDGLGDQRRGTGLASDDRSLGSDSTREVIRSEEQLRVGTTTEETGRVRARKLVDVEQVTERVERGREQADMDRVDVADGETDSGQVETLPDGSLSIPVFEEQIVVTKRLVVRERVIIRKHTVFEEQVVTADLKRERLEIEAIGDAVIDDPGYDGTTTGVRGNAGSIDTTPADTREARR